MRSSLQKHRPLALSIRTPYIFWIRWLSCMKSELAQLRMTPDEKRAFHEAAKIAGVSFSTWARQALRRAAIREFNDAGRRLDFYPPHGVVNARNDSL